ncbi:MAG: hypothetical protein IPP83_18735 [Flavobacteriales bacterium]|nr:hypothetical protein [Flavobacteriales bacterium]MBL0129434.1 hypothetical protein [Flavobacteriales bacterium]MCC6939149.1 hypothetical protein [Flavobacteriales bacterium]
MGKLAEKKIAVVERILRTEDPGIIDSVDELLDRGSFALSAAQQKELDEIRAKHLSGDGGSSPWPEARKRILRKLRK